MNMKNEHFLQLTASVLLVGVVALSSMANAQVTVPNVFENGQTADADQVNANFKALEEGINNVPAGAKGEKGDTGANGVDGLDGIQGPAGMLSSSAQQRVAFCTDLGSALLGSMKERCCEAFGLSSDCL